MLLNLLTAVTINVAENLETMVVDSREKLAKLKISKLSYKTVGEFKSNVYRE